MVRRPSPIRKAGLVGVRKSGAGEHAAQHLKRARKPRPEVRARCVAAASAQSPLGRRLRDQIRVSPSPSSSSTRLA